MFRKLLFSLAFCLSASVVCPKTNEGFGEIRKHHEKCIQKLSDCPYDELLSLMQELEKVQDCSNSQLKKQTVSGYLTVAFLLAASLSDGDCAKNLAGIGCLSSLAAFSYYGDFFGDRLEQNLGANRLLRGVRNEVECREIMKTLSFDVKNHSNK